MDAQIVAALIGAGATILVALAGKVPVEKLASRWIRQRNNIPEIMGTKWRAEWLREDGTLHNRDEVTLSRWTKKSRFEGYGEATYDNVQYKYLIEGEVSPRGIVVLTYKAERYPTEANIGTACLELSNNAKELVGYWSGRTFVEQGGKTLYMVQAGRVEMRWIRELKE